MTNAGTWGAYLAPWLLWLAGCLSPLQAPSAFSSEVYLCDAENAAALQASIDDCQQRYAQTQSCHGIVSWRGTVDSQSVVVESDIGDARISDTPRSDGSISRELALYGSAPYFTFSIDIREFGVPGKSTTGPVLTAECVSPDTAKSCNVGILNLEARGGTYLSPINSLVRDVQVDTTAELRVGFSGALARGGSIEGCFDLFLGPQP